MSAGFVIGARQIGTTDLALTCDVCVIGSGAGGAVLAAGLAARGLDVIVLEEGGAYTSADFRRLDEAWSLPTLYQERGGRATADQAITVLQGRSVGGGTTVNWTTCFRMPERILDHWRQVHGLALTAEALAPHFAAIEDRLGIATWDAVAPNENNHKLELAGAALGWETARTRRNVRGCANSGYCGFGCPFDAKQAMHLTYVPDALAAGARVYADTRADRLELDGTNVARVHATVMDPDRDRGGPVKITVSAARVAVCGGAINSPALLLRSGLDDGVVGRRTFLHPVVAAAGRFADRVDGWYGAPQSVASHQFVDRGPDASGFFLEHAPIHPMLSGVSFPGFGAGKNAMMGTLSHTATMIAIHVDGLAPDDAGGTVSLRGDGRIRLDYPVSDRLARGFRASHEVLVRGLFAAGAIEVSTLHAEPVVFGSVDDLSALDRAAYGALRHSIFSAHQMGGCPMGPDPATSVVDPALRHHRVPNLWVVDGSVLPTALGVNPSETIYGIAHWAVEGVSAG
ncbi:MAG: GMC family oxidoreductase [Myxococcota bacterium]